MQAKTFFFLQISYLLVKRITLNVAPKNERGTCHGSHDDAHPKETRKRKLVLVTPPAVVIEPVETFQVNTEKLIA